MVVQVSTCKVNPNAFATTSLDHESKGIDTFGKRIFSITSLALRSVNASCLLSRYSHALWDTVTQLLPAVPMTFEHPLLKLFRLIFTLQNL